LRTDAAVSQITVTVDPNVYPLSVVKKAAYRLGGRCFVHIEAPPGGDIRVTLTARPGDPAPETLVGEFDNHLLDQDLRESIAQETERVRNLILAQAFSGLSLTDAAADSADYCDDPLGIGRSQAEGQ
jgi:His-Xaa-Ser system protein HxsD